MSAVIDLERGTLAGSSQAISRPATEPTGTVPAPAAEPLSRLQLSPSPTLIFEVDVENDRFVAISFFRLHYLFLV